MISQKNILNELQDNTTVEETTENGIIHYKKTFGKYVIENVTSNHEITDNAALLIKNEVGQISSLDYILKRRTRVKAALLLVQSELLKEDIKDNITFKKEETPPKVEQSDAIQETPPKVNFDLNSLFNTAAANAIQANAANVNIMVQAYLDKNGIRPTKNTIEIHNIKTGEKRDIGAQHTKFNDVLIMASCRLNIMLVGAPATGKSTFAPNIADALNLDFYKIGLSAATPPSAIFGYNNAVGDFVDTQFYNAYKKGGVFLLDEIDNGNPNTTAGINDAISSDKAAFANGMIKKHKDFILISTANTFGKGATADFVGRNPIDAATLDRFIIVAIDYDKDLELTFTNDKKWCKLVQAYRAEAERKKIRCFITPRATIYGATLLSQGISKKDVLEYCIFKGMNKDERNLLSNIKG